MWSSSSIVRSSMGQKTHPIGFRLGVIKPWKSRWYAESDFGKLLQEDETIRRYLSRRLSRSEEHTSELQSRGHLVCRLLLEKKKNVREYRRGDACDTS